jgi:hypothetical protein
MLQLTRCLHIFCGVFWVGAVCFNMLIFGPALGLLDPDARLKVMGAIARRGGPKIMSTAAITTVCAGIGLLAFYPGLGNLGSLWTSGWGRSITVGGLAGMGTFVIGDFMIKPRLQQMGALGAQEGAAAELDRLGKQVMKLGAVEFLLGVTAVLCMALAKHSG